MNWGTYVWAIGSGHAIDTALGYYINPLVNVVLGGIFLSERLSKAQMVAVALASCAVVLLTVSSGGLPWISLVLAFSFGFYGFFRKTLADRPDQGFMLEVLLLSIPSLGLHILDRIAEAQAISSMERRTTSVCCCSQDRQQPCRSSSMPLAQSSCATRQSA